MTPTGSATAILSSRASPPSPVLKFRQNTHPAMPNTKGPCSVSDPGLNHCQPHHQKTELVSMYPRTALPQN
ncbi:MAG: hypothetical protein J6386_07975 [Candidatus Synoicihabitans palmerolidicus]|nr:hypothetical protein [Candidatus Synoicihabitans palmerolidicus]